MHPVLRTLLALPFLLSVAGYAVAATPEELIRPIQDEWADIKYRQPEKQQAELYHALAERAHKIVEAHPGSAEALIWEGIVVSSEAGAKCGLGALPLAKEAKQRLDDALKAAPRPGCELADSGRRQEIQALLAKLNK